MTAPDLAKIADSIAGVLDAGNTFSQFKVNIRFMEVEEWRAVVAALRSVPSAVAAPDDAAKALFEKNAAGYRNATPWADLHEDTKQLWRDEAAKRVPSSTAPSEAQNMEAHTLMLELCHQLGAQDGEHMVDMLFAAVKDALRYRHLREHWGDFTGYDSKEPGPWLDRTIDAALAPSAIGAST